MIVRVLDAEVKPGKMDGFLDLIRTSLLPRVVASDGFLGIEFLRSVQGEEQVLLVSRWRDEQALAAYAGPLWRVRAPLVDHVGADYLARTSHVHHYIPEEVQPPVTAENTSANVATDIDRE